jgi:hypothetical protein
MYSQSGAPLKLGRDEDLLWDLLENLNPKIACCGSTTSMAGEGCARKLKCGVYMRVANYAD